MYLPKFQPLHALLLWVSKAISPAARGIQRPKDHCDAIPTPCKHEESDPSLPTVFPVNLSFLLIRTHSVGWPTLSTNYFTKAQLAVRHLMRFTISSFLIFHYYFMFPTRIFRRRCLTTQSDGSLMARIRVWNSLREGSLARLHSPVSGGQPGTSVSDSCCWLGTFPAPGITLSCLYRRIFTPIQ